MAIREIREIGEACLNKNCKEVKEMTDRRRILIEDMIETMHDAEGVGLAAPQVGILRRIVVIDVSEEGDSKGSHIYKRKGSKSRSYYMEW